ncbi:MAG: hypothetical protein C4344_06310 [Acidimicrobiia bacterium]
MTPAGGELRGARAAGRGRARVARGRRRTPPAPMRRRPRARRRASRSPWRHLRDRGAPPRGGPGGERARPAAGSR